MLLDERVVQEAVWYAVVNTVNNNLIKHKMKQTASLRVCYTGQYTCVLYWPVYMCAILI